VVKTGKMCRIAQNYEHGRTLPLHAVRWLGIMIDSQNIPLRRMSTNEIRISEDRYLILYLNNPQ